VVAVRSLTSPYDMCGARTSAVTGACSGRTTSATGRARLHTVVRTAALLRNTRSVVAGIEAVLRSLQVVTDTGMAG
jgi:hypothetical protein